MDAPAGSIGVIGKLSCGATAVDALRHRGLGRHRQRRRYQIGSARSLQPATSPARLSPGVLGVPEINCIDVVTYSIGEHRYVLIVHPGQEVRAYTQLGRWATDPRHPFGWRDAAALALKLPRQSQIGPTA
jgi:hypothetical protein